MRSISKLLLICSALMFSSGAFSATSNELRFQRLNLMKSSIELKVIAKTDLINSTYGEGSARALRLIGLLDTSSSTILARLQVQIDLLASPN